MSMTDNALGQTENSWNRYVCIHGHFYQPPRENPWLELIEVEDSAAPYHDWNERICAECYAPNTQARIVDSSSKVQRMINNYEWISFNIGPTLLAWLESYAPKVLMAIQDADRKSLERCQGHGNAIAQVYNHVILPLAGKRDKIIQVRWGIEVFRHYFKREPEGMWLSETAVDIESLETLADHGILFAILSPHQAHRIQSPDGGKWSELNGNFPDTRRPYRCHLPSGKTITLFFYNGEVAQQVAFQNLLDNGEEFYQRMLSLFDSKNAETQIVHIATDGETFGHHHMFGEMALAYFISRMEEDSRIRMTNYGEFLSSNPPIWEVEIVENSSWSCIHGIERWRSDCGCHTSGSNLHQRWRAPLREALDDLKNKVDQLFAREGQRFFKDPWKALDAYIFLLLDRSEKGVNDYFIKTIGQVPEEEELIRALKLMEMARHGQLMFTSCAWFFDDVSGIETVQILKFAARTMQLAEKNFGGRFEEDFLSILQKAPSNHLLIGDGRALYEKEIKPAIADLERVLAHFAISMIFRTDTSSRVGTSYSLKNIDDWVQETGQTHFAVGTVEVFSHVVRQKRQDIYAVIHFGGLDVQFFWKPYTGLQDYEELKKKLINTFEEASFGNLYQQLLNCFQQPTHQLKDLFLDEQRKILEIILKERIEDYQNFFDQLFEQDQALLKQLGLLRYPIPEPMKMAAKVAAERRIRGFIDQIEGKDDIQTISLFLEQAKQWGYRPDVKQWGLFFLLLLEKQIQTLWDFEAVPKILRSIEGILKVAELLEVPLNLWNIQNLYVEICKKRAEFFKSHKEAIKSFAIKININPDVLPPSLH